MYWETHIDNEINTEITTITYSDDDNIRVL